MYDGRVDTTIQLGHTSYTTIVSPTAYAEYVRNSSSAMTTVRCRYAELRIVLM